MTLGLQLFLSSLLFNHNAHQFILSAFQRVLCLRRLLQYEFISLLHFLCLHYRFFLSLCFEDKRIISWLNAIAILWHFRCAFRLIEVNLKLRGL